MVINFSHRQGSKSIEFSTNRLTTELVVSEEFFKLLKKYIKWDHHIQFKCEKENSNEILCWSVLGKLMHDCYFDFMSDTLRYRLNIVGPHVKPTPPKRWWMSLPDISTEEVGDLFKQIEKLAVFLSIKKTNTEIS